MEVSRGKQVHRTDTGTVFHWVIPWTAELIFGRHPLVRKLQNLPSRVGGASFALGMMLSHLAKSCDTTVLSCLSFQSLAFLLSRKHCRYMIDSPLGFFWNLSNPTFLSSSPAEKSHQYTQTIQAPTLLRVKHLSDRLNSSMIFFSFPPP